MSYRTILAYFAAEKTSEAEIALATMLAREQGAHLIGLFVVPPAFVDVYPELTVSYDQLYAEQRTRLLDEADRIRAKFETACKREDFVFEWRCIDAEGTSVARAILDQARSADLIVLPRAASDDGIVDQRATVRQVMMAAGRPILLTPETVPDGLAGRDAVLAWNGSRESARAAFDALDLLKTARNVRVVWVNPSANGRRNTWPVADIVTALARHDVACESTDVSAPDSSAGEAILDLAEKEKAALLVMGAYGHSRFREMVFGGATRHVLDHAKLPVLLSH